MRRKPIGTGPFKFVEFKMNESIKLTKNTDYWKPGRPYLDGIEYTIIADRSTRMLAFASGKFDMTFPTDVTVPLLKNIRKDPPRQNAHQGAGIRANLIVNREVPPFDGEPVGAARARSTRAGAFIDILSEGEIKVGGFLHAGRRRGMPPDMLKTHHRLWRRRPRSRAGPPS